MKNFQSILLFLLPLFSWAQQSPPVAVNDTIHVYIFDDTLTINVLQNDYDPDGDPITVLSCPGSVGHTDSTITYYFQYKYYCRRNGIDYSIYYLIGDSTGDTTMGEIVVWIHNPYYAFLDINGVNARINNRGGHFWDNYGQAQYFVPAGSGKSSIFLFSAWIGGLDANNQLHLAGGRYSEPSSDYWSGPATDTIHYSNVFDTIWNKTWKITRTEIEYHKQHWWIGGYSAPASILTWPGNGNTTLGQQAQLAPYHDFNNNGTYEPQEGDYPLIKGDQAVFFIMNDTRRPHTETGGQKMGLEIHGMAYAFDCPDDSALWYTTFLHYDIYNRSSNSYHDTYLATWVDTDVGDSWDDYVGCDISRGSFYDYNGYNIDGHGNPDEYGAFPPAISTTILGGPFMDPDNLDNPNDSLGFPLCDFSINGFNFNDGTIDNERFGMCRFIGSKNDGSGPFQDPDKAQEYYMRMQGYWKDSTHIKYGGNGHQNGGSTSIDCRFTYPDTSDFCNWGTDGIQPPGFITGAGGTGISWTEGNVGNVPYDKRGNISMGPFTFNPGDKQELDVAFIWARQYTDSSATAVLPLLATRIDQIRSYFLNDSTPCGGSFSGISSPKKTEDRLWIYPNPVKDILYVKFIGKPGTQYPSGDGVPGCGRTTYRIVSITGQTLTTGEWNKNDTRQISVSHLKSGVYLLVISDNLSVKTARFIKQ